MNPMKIELLLSPKERVVFGVGNRTVNLLNLAVEADLGV
jgi:hypothetical protein